MNKQLDTWRGSFGDSYIERNPVSEESTRRKLRDWSAILSCVRGRPPASILEVGANVGQNLAALRRLTDAELFAVEPNARARATLVESGILDQGHALEGHAGKLPLADGAVDLAFTSGVLIHIAPSELPAAYREIHRVSRRYVLSVEYFSDQPVEKRYRGSDDLLFLRDFGGYWLENFSDLAVVDFGFLWKPFSGDSLNWWLFEKKS